MIEDSYTACAISSKVQETCAQILAGVGRHLLRSTIGSANLVCLIGAFGLCLGCSDEAEDVEAASTGEAVAPTRMMKIDAALAEWYNLQAGAAFQIECHSGQQFAPIYKDRDPREILVEQKKMLPWIRECKGLGRIDHAEAIRLWYVYQIAAANCLRDLLGDERIASAPELSLEAVLSLQLADVATLKEEIASHGRVYWRNETENGPDESGIDRETN